MIEIRNIDGHLLYSTNAYLAMSDNDPTFVYRVGETVRPATDFDDNRWNEHSSGIHFYITRSHAEAH